MCQLINQRENTGSRVARVRIVFSFPPQAKAELPAGIEHPQHLAYVDYYSAFRERSEPNHGMYKVSRLAPNNLFASAIIPVTSILRSVHLFPKFGPVAPRDWTSSNVLDQCTDFYTSPWSDRHAYISMY